MNHIEFFNEVKETSIEDLQVIHAFYKMQLDKEVIGDSVECTMSLRHALGKLVQELGYL